MTPPHWPAVGTNRANASSAKKKKEREKERKRRRKRKKKEKKKKEKEEERKKERKKERKEERKKKMCMGLEPPTLQFRVKSAKPLHHGLLSQLYTYVTLHHKTNKKSHGLVVCYG